MATIHSFPRSHSARPVLEQQLAVLALELAARYGTEKAVDTLCVAVMDLQGLALHAAAQNDK